MNDSTDNDFSARLAPLISLAPLAEDTARILELAKHTSGRRRAIRWSVTGGLAALVVITVSVTLSVMQRSVSAAEALTQAVQTTKQYRGWVHVHIRQSNSDAKALTMMHHLNNESGTSVIESRVGGRFRVTMIVPDDLLTTLYDSETGKVTRHHVDKRLADMEKPPIQNFALTPEAAVAKVPGTSMRQSNDGNLIRFDVTLPADDQQKADAEHRGLYPKKMAIWIDPATRLIQKVETATVDGITWESSVTYGNPIIHNVYDVGVPRNADVVDLGSDQKVTKLLDRLLPPAK